MGTVESAPHEVMAVLDHHKQDMTDAAYKDIAEAIGRSHTRAGAGKGCMRWLSRNGCRPPGSPQAPPAGASG